MTKNKRFELRFIGGDTFITDNENYINHFVGFEDITDDFKCIVGLLNELYEENQALKKDIGDLGKAHAKEITKIEDTFDEEILHLEKDNNALIKMIENQSYIIEQLHTKLIEYELKEPIKLTVEDIELMGKAISYYTHGGMPR